MYCTVFVTVFVTTAKFYGMNNIFVTVFVTTAKFNGMNNILLVRLKSSTLQKFSQLKSRI